MAQPHPSKARRLANAGLRVTQPIVAPKDRKVRALYAGVVANVLAYIRPEAKPLADNITILCSAYMAARMARDIQWAKGKGKEPKDG